MKKSLFIFAAAALALTACTSENEATQTATPKAAPQAIAFETYVPTVTRAGWAGVMTTSALQDPLKGNGFGVFAVQSDNEGYAATYKPNFMWNQHVEYSASSWTYSPLKYWPNETDNDSQSANAESDHIDRLSFFAYAPYVAELTSTYDGSLTGVTYDDAPNNYPTSSAHNAKSTMYGILGVSANTDATNDPYVWYRSNITPSASVDLVWGVAPAGDLSYTSVAAGLTNAIGNTDITTGTVTVDEGFPLLNLIKPVKDEKIKFLFKHALARLGVTVVAAVDQISAGGNLGTGTKIAVESIKINATGTNKLYTEGRLNLNNTTSGQALWVSPSQPITALTIDETHELSKEILWKTNPTTTLALTGFTGVDKTEKKAIRTSGAADGVPAYFMLIPSHANTDLKVTITYYVFTADPKLNDATYGNYAVTKNVIDKTITIPGLTNNKAYNLKLVLGLTSVKLDAEVADWEVDGSSEVYLPQNKE